MSFCILTSNDSSCSSTAWSAFHVDHILYLQHSNGCMYVIVLISNFLMAYDMEHIVMDLFDTICFGEISAKVFHPFLIRLFLYCWVLRVIFIFWLTVLYQTCLLQIFSPRLLFSFSWYGLLLSRLFFISLKPSISITPFMGCAFGVPSKKSSNLFYLLGLL